MVIYFLKSGICLAVFYSFYKLLLEKESFHIVKRFYLLASLLLAFGIPLITFTKYIEVTPQINTSIKSQWPNVVSTANAAQLTTYIPAILWSIYGVGSLLFGLRFIQNLLKITNKIKRNPKLKVKRFTNVLVQESIIPHTFFSYIFLNKHKFEINQIPTEVLLHEETHALQKHSLDILLIEVLQIIFWFNPLIYFIKHSIKLNHEFLADQAVINKGVLPSTYQQILLAFSSPDSYRDARTHQLANAINYSSIKKRFTVMKTQTSKQKMWILSLLLLPLVALSLYGFSEKKMVEKQSEKTNQINTLSLKENPILEISFNPDVFKLNGTSTSLSELKNDFIKVTNNEKSDLDIKMIGSVHINFIEQIMSELKDNMIKINLDEAVYIIDDQIPFETQQKATSKEVAEYNKLAKHYSAKPERSRIIKLEDLKRLEYIYNKMTEQQKASAEPLPNYPPPPPAPKVIKGKALPPPSPIPADATPAQKKKMQVAIEDYNNKVPPPPPKSPLDYVIDMAKKGAAFYHEGNSISSDEAISLLKKNDKLNIQTKQSNSKQPKVYISLKPIVIKN